MTARWHVGPITDGYFWWVLVTSPEILVFLFFMITDPKTIPSTPRMRILYAVSVGLLACILIAPARTEFWSKVAVLGSLTVVCVAWPLLKRYWPPLTITRTRIALVAAGVLALYGAALVSAGIPARSSGIAAPLTFTGRLPEITIGTSLEVQSKLARENRAPDRRRPGRRSRAPAARARAPGRQGTCTRGHFRSPARVATAAPSRTWPSHSRRRVPPRPDGRPLRGGQRPGRGDRRGDPGRHTAADDVLRDPRGRPAPCGADRLPRDARAPERRRPLAGRARPAPARRERPLTCRRPGSRRGLRRRPPHRCRAEGRPELPPGRVPLRSHRGPAGDDGRRRLLARLRRRRLDGPLRRQLLRRGRHRRLRHEPAAQRPLSGTTTGSGSRRSTRPRRRAARAASRPT